LATTAAQIGLFCSPPTPRRRGVDGEQWEMALQAPKKFSKMSLSHCARFARQSPRLLCPVSGPSVEGAGRKRCLLALTARLPGGPNRNRAFQPNTDGRARNLFHRTVVLARCSAQEIVSIRQPRGANLPTQCPITQSPKKHRFQSQLAMRARNRFHRRLKLGRARSRYLPNRHASAQEIVSLRPAHSLRVCQLTASIPIFQETLPTSHQRLRPLGA
jgi:hypothetical protein